MCYIISCTTSLKQYTYSQNNILTPQKQCTSQNSFKKPVKETILKLCNKFDYFSIHISMKRLAKESSTWYVHKIFRGSINYPLIRRRTSACQGVRNVAFSGRIVCILCGWLLLAILGSYWSAESIWSIISLGALR